MKRTLTSFYYEGKPLGACFVNDKQANRIAKRLAKSITYVDIYHGSRLVKTYSQNNTTKTTKHYG